MDADHLEHKVWLLRRNQSSVLRDECCRWLVVNTVVNTQLTWPLLRSFLLGPAPSAPLASLTPAYAAKELGEGSTNWWRAGSQAAGQDSSAWEYAHYQMTLPDE